MKKIFLALLLLISVNAFCQDNPQSARGKIAIKWGRLVYWNGNEWKALADSTAVSSGGSMVYPSAGIPLSTGTAWGTSITDNSTNWNTAFSWGNHASAGYLTTETDPLSVKSANNLSDLNSSTIARTNIGLGNVTNESKFVMFTSPVFTGNVTASTITSGLWNGTKIGMAYGGVPTGGLSGQVLSKASNSDNDLTWVTTGGLGTVTNVTATNNTGQTWTITTPSTTPNLSLALTSAAVGLSNVENTALSTWAGSTNLTTIGALSKADFVNSATPSTPSTGNSSLYVKNIGGHAELSLIDDVGEIQHFQPSLSFNTLKGWFPAAATTINLLSSTITSVGTISHTTPATTNLKTSATRFTNTSAATAAALASNRPGLLECTRGNAANIGGFKVVLRFSLTTLQAGMRMFAGLSSTATTAPANVDPTVTTTDAKLGMAINTNTGNWNLIHNTAGTAPTVIDLGASFPVNNTSVYELVLSCPPNSANVYYRIKNLSTPAETSGTLSTNLPLNTAYMGRLIWATNNATAASVAYDVYKFTVETDY